MCCRWFFEAVQDNSRPELCRTLVTLHFEQGPHEDFHLVDALLLQVHLLTTYTPSDGRVHARRLIGLMLCVDIWCDCLHQNGSTGWFFVHKQTRRVHFKRPQ